MTNDGRSDASPAGDFDPVARPPGTAEEEAVAGGASYLDVLARVHQVLEPSLYLEIGVRHGRSLSLATCRAIGIDPRPEVTIPLGSETEVVTMTSDEFFASSQSRQLTSQPPDVVFIDGMHLFEYVLRDFMNVERCAEMTTLVVVDDILPVHIAQAQRVRRTRAWTGDVWKLVPCLQRYRPDLFIQIIDSAPTGLLFVTALDPTSRVLPDAYDRILSDGSARQAQPPRSILARDGALSTSSAALERMLTMIAQARATPSDRGTYVEGLRSVTGDTQ